MEDEIIKDKMVRCAQNLDRTICLEGWDLLWTKTLKALEATNLKENLYKMFYRGYLTPDKIAKFAPGIPNLCWKCNKTEGTFFHMWWGCKYAERYWKGIKTVLK